MVTWSLLLPISPVLFTLPDLITCSLFLPKSAFQNSFIDLLLCEASSLAERHRKKLSTRVCVCLERRAAP